MVGAGAAAAVALFEFPGRRVFEWALLLPLAMPAYVLAYVYTDFLQFSGPLQSALRALTGAQGALWPDVRSLPGAIVLFVLALYPYVYLLVRTALAERGMHLMEAARLLGAGFWRRVREVALPLSRPALVAGVALALMETLADYGVGAYFGLTTLSTGIYKAWLVMNDRVAAAQIASVLLIVVAALLFAERRARSALRFAATRISATDGREARPVVLRGRLALLAWVLCALPVALGFVLPLVLLARLVWREAVYGERRPAAGALCPVVRQQLPARRAGCAAAAALALALVFVARVTSPRDPRTRALEAGATLVSLGYAVPGAVIAVGILLPLGAVQALWPSLPLAAVVTGTVARPAVRLPRALLGGGAADGGSRLHAIAAEPGRQRAHARRLARPPAGAGARAAAQTLAVRGDAAGLRRRDEGTAGHAGAAALQQRHAGGGGLQPGARRAPGRSGAAVDRDRRGGSAAGAAAGASHSQVSPQRGAPGRNRTCI